MESQGSLDTGRESHTPQAGKPAWALRCSYQVRPLGGSPGWRCLPKAVLAGPDAASEFSQVWADKEQLANMKRYAISENQQKQHDKFRDPPQTLKRILRYRI